MDFKRKLIGALFAIIAGSGLLVACGSGVGDSCEEDSDCGTDMLCDDQGYCAYECGVDFADCDSGDVCTERKAVNDGKKVCVSPGGPPVTGNNPNPDVDECEEPDDCTDITGPNSVCVPNNKGVNICKSTDPSAKEYIAVEIRDVTTAANRCSDTTGGKASPATKLTYVQLFAADNTSLGFGKAVGYNLEGDQNDFDRADLILDGKPNNLGGQCSSEFKTDKDGIALGCGGYVVVQFMDSSGNAITLEDGQDVLVGAYGNSCNSNFDEAKEDRYDVYLCEDRGTENVSNATCKTKLTGSPQTSLAKVPVTIP